MEAGFGEDGEDEGAVGFFDEVAVEAAVGDEFAVTGFTSSVVVIVVFSALDSATVTTAPSSVLDFLEAGRYLVKSSSSSSFTSVRVFLLTLVSSRF